MCTAALGDLLAPTSPACLPIQLCPGSLVCTQMFVPQHKAPRLNRTLRVPFRVPFRAPSGLAPHLHFHLQVWHTAHYNLLGVHTGHTEPVLCLAFDGNFLVSGSQDGTIRLWDAVPVSRESLLLPVWLVVTLHEVLTSLMEAELFSVTQCFRDCFAVTLTSLQLK